jgi:hypothetical protein
MAASLKPRRALAAEEVVNKTREEVVEILLALSDNLDGRVLRKPR